VFAGVDTAVGRSVSVRKPRIPITALGRSVDSRMRDCSCVRCGSGRSSVAEQVAPYCPIRPAAIVRCRQSGRRASQRLPIVATKTPPFAGGSAYAVNWRIGRFWQQVAETPTRLGAEHEPGVIRRPARNSGRLTPLDPPAVQRQRSGILLHPATTHTLPQALSKLRRVPVTTL
jgi:hypothetical protein